MQSIGDTLQHSDWKTEKHAPAITCPSTVGAGEPFAIEVMIGRETAHPNTAAHHIRWIRLYFKPDQDKFAYDLGSSEFNAHGESASEGDGPALTDPVSRFTVRVSKAGTLHAISYCNIHGLWESTQRIEVS